MYMKPDNNRIPSPYGGWDNNNYGGWDNYIRHMGGSRIFEGGGSILGLQAKKGGGVQEGVQLWAQC